VSQIVAGGMENINGKAEKNFPELRKQMESNDPDYCRSGAPLVPMSDLECRAKITADIEVSKPHLILTTHTQSRGGGVCILLTSSL